MLVTKQEQQRAPLPWKPGTFWRHNSMWQERARAFSKASQIDANVRKSQWQENSGPGSWPPVAWRTSSDLLESFGPSRAPACAQWTVTFETTWGASRGSQVCFWGFSSSWGQRPVFQSYLTDSVLNNLKLSFFKIQSVFKIRILLTRFMGSVIAFEGISIGRVPQRLGTVILNPCLLDLVRFENLPLSLAPLA